MTISPETMKLLRAERDRLTQEREQLTSSIEAVDGVLGLYEQPKSDGRAPKPRAKTSGTGTGGGRKPTWDVEKGRALWDRGVPVKEIAAAMGISVSGMKTYARSHWPKRPKSDAGKRSDPMVGRRSIAPTPCPSCERTTLFNPCQHCHVQLPTASGR